MNKLAILLIFVLPFLYVSYIVLYSLTHWGLMQFGFDITHIQFIAALLLIVVAKFIISK